MERIKDLTRLLNESRINLNGGKMYKEDVPRLLNYMPYKSCGNFTIQLVRHGILNEFREKQRKYYRFPKDPIYFKNVESYMKSQNSYFNKKKKETSNNEILAIEYLKKLGYLVFKQI